MGSPAISNFETKIRKSESASSVASRLISGLIHIECLFEKFGMTHARCLKDAFLLGILDKTVLSRSLLIDSIPVGVMLR